MIGIGVTTHNRPEMLSQCVDSIVRHTSAFEAMVVVDDASEPPAKTGLMASYRFEENVGVARAKNKCIELLMNTPAEHVFLFDDDTWPEEDGWWEPYVESGINHLSWNWFPKWDDTRRAWPIGDGPDYPLTGWNTSNGCMLYYTRKAIETAGGMRLNFGKWGFEHMEHSQRIHKFGLTTEPFISLSHQHGIYATDEHQEVKDSPWSSITPAERREWYQRNYALYAYWIEKEPEFVPWS